MTEDGITLSGWWQPAPNAWGTLVFVHGLDGNRTSDGAPSLAADLANAGLSTLLFDLRAHGRSEGGRVGGAVLEQRDVAAAVAAARLRDPTHPIGLVGFSLGARPRSSRPRPSRTSAPSSPTPPSRT